MKSNKNENSEKLVRFLNTLDHIAFITSDKILDENDEYERRWIKFDNVTEYQMSELQKKFDYFTEKTGIKVKCYWDNGSDKGRCVSIKIY